MGSRRRNHRLTGLCAVALAAATALPAHAEPYVGRTLRGITSFDVEGSDGLTRTIEIVVEEGAGAASWAMLEVGITACSKSTCSEAARYGKTLDPTEFEAASDGSSATVQTQFAGEELTITWVRPSAFSSLAIDASVPQSVSVGNSGGAAVSATLLGVACNANGELADVVEVNSDRAVDEPGPEPAKLPKGFAPRGRARPNCAE